MAQPFDDSRARLSQPDMFQRFRVPDEGKPITELGWPRDEDILVVDRGRQRLAFRIRQMTYHHLAQGELAGQPYIAGRGYSS